MDGQRSNGDRLTVNGEFARPSLGAILEADDVRCHMPLSGLPAWRSHGGKSPTHPDRSLPLSVDFKVPVTRGRIERIELLGVFALEAGRECEDRGTIGAAVEVRSASRLLARHELVNGRHYSDAKDLSKVGPGLGDGTSVETVGTTVIDGVRCRVDLLGIDFPTGHRPTMVTFRDLGTPASFVLFDVFFPLRPEHRCPFHPDSGKIALSEISAIVRIGDRVRMCEALGQLEEGVLSMGDLDEARGEALTFLAIVTAATLETGGSREMHRVQLQAARTFDRLSTPQDIAESVTGFVRQVAPNLFREPRDPNADLMDHALALINRHFARPITDVEVARNLGLSTSHFRHLFRVATGQPFHKYLLSLRLEKAHSMISHERVSVTEVAKAVGFSGVSHFSRAFTGRFAVRPSEIRRDELRPLG